MSDPLSTCLQALDALYNNPDGSVKKQADQWLTQLQKEPMAWQVADQLLHRPSLPEQAYFFAATTLHSKLLFSFHELSESTHRLSFRDSLMTHLQRFKNGTDLVKRTLEICMACLGVHLMSLGEWSNCIDQLIDTFGPQPDTAPMLLDILAFLPDENENPKLLLPNVLRARAQQAMLPSTQRIIGLLMHYLAASSVGSTLEATASNGAVKDYVSSGILNTPNSGPQAVRLPPVTDAQREMQRRILNCLHNWVKANGASRRRFEHHPHPPHTKPSEPTAFSSLTLIGHPLVLFAFKILAGAATAAATATATNPSQQDESDERVSSALGVLCSLLKNFKLDWVVNATRQGGGFRKASDYVDEDEEGQVDEDEDGSPGGFGGYPPSPDGTSLYGDLYFMRFMIHRCLDLVPLFDALPIKVGGDEEESDSGSNEVARQFSRVFVDLGEYYLEFLVHFCLGTQSFNVHATRDQKLLADMQVAMNMYANTPAAVAATLNEPQQLESLIESNRELSFRIVQLVLKCSAHPLRRVSCNSLYFWYQLSKAITAHRGGASGSTRHNVSSQSQHSSTHAPSLTPLQIRQKKRESFIPIFCQLVSHLHRLMTYPSDYVPPALDSTRSSSSSTYREEVHRSRTMAADALGDVEKVVGYERILEILCSEGVMGAQLRRFMTNKKQWHALEASLYCIRNLGRKVCASLRLMRRDLTTAQAFTHGGLTNQRFLPQIFDLILDPQSPLMHVEAIKYTALMVIGRYAAWVHDQAAAVDANVSNPSGAASAEVLPATKAAYLPKVLYTIVQGLQDPLVVSAASLALRSTCEANCQRLANCRNPDYLSNLLIVFQQCMTQPIVHTHMDKQRGGGEGDEEDEDGTAPAGMTFLDQKEIIAGVVAVVCSIHIPDDQAQSTDNILVTSLHQLVSPIMTELQKLLTWAQQHGQVIPVSSPTSAAATAIATPTTPSSPSSSTTIMLPPDASHSLLLHLDRLGEIFSCLAEWKHKSSGVFVPVLLNLFQKQIASVLYTIMQHLTSEERRMDKLCRIFKHVIKATRLAFLESGLVQPLIESLSRSFSLYPHACFLYLLSICIDHFGVHPAFHPVLQHILPPFLSNSLKGIDSEEGMRNDPNMTEDFFETTSKILKNCPAILFQLQMLPEIIEHAIYGLVLHHHESLSSVTHFLGLFLEQGVEDERVRSKRAGPVVPQHAQTIRMCLQRYGQKICSVIMSGITGGLPQSRVHMLAGPLEQLVHVCGEGCRPWLVESLSNAPITVDPTKQEFIDTLLAGGRSVSRLICDYADACRIKDK